MTASSEVNSPAGGGAPLDTPMTLSEVWRDKALNALSQPYLVALMLGSLLLSAASFFTTFAGMLHFMPIWAVTFCIVFAIQALLFVASWRIGFSLADRDTPPLFTGFVFLICLATSVFFSWVALFETINDPETQERTRVTRIHSAVEEAVGELTTRAAADRRAQYDALLDSDAYAAWGEAVNAATRLALDARGAIDAARDAESAALAARIQEAEAERKSLLRSEAATGERADAAEREIAQLEARRAEAISRVTALRAEAAAAGVAVERKQGEMDAEERGGAAGAGAGRGPIWRGLRDEREVLAAELDTKSRLLAAAQSDVADADRRLQDLRAEVAAARAGGRAAELGLVDARLTQLNARVTAAGGRETNDLSGDVAALRADLSQFETRFDLAAFERAAARCDNLLDILRGEPSIAARSAGLSCERETLAPALNAVRASNAAVASLAARCAPGGAAAATISSLSFNDAVAYGRECAAISGLPSERLADLRAEIDRLVLEEDPNASQFVKTVNAWNGGDKLSHFALAIALFIDLLVLLSGLIGAVSVTSGMGRAFGRRFAKRDIDDARRALSIKRDPLAIANAILDTVAPSASKRYPGRVIIEDVAPDLRGGVRQFLLQQRSKGLVVDAADPTGATPSFLPPLFGGARPQAQRHGEMFLLKETALSALRAYIEEKSQETVKNTQRRDVADAHKRTIRMIGKQMAPAAQKAALGAIFRGLEPLYGARYAPARLRHEGRIMFAQMEKRLDPADRDFLLADVKQLCFALYRRRLARPVVEKLENERITVGYLFTSAGIDLMESTASQLNGVTHSQRAPELLVDASPALGPLSEHDAAAGPYPLERRAEPPGREPKTGDSNVVPLRQLDVVSLQPAADAPSPEPAPSASQNEPEETLLDAAWLEESARAPDLAANDPELDVNDEALVAGEESHEAIAEAALNSPPSGNDDGFGDLDSFFEEFMSQATAQAKAATDRQNSRREAG